MDGVIVVESYPNTTSAVSFVIENAVPQPSPYICSFTPDSPMEFSVSPRQGVMAAQGAGGTEFVVAFSPSAREYGKDAVGRLMVRVQAFELARGAAAMTPLLPHMRQPPGVGGDGA